MRSFLSKYRQYAGLLLAALLVGIDQLTKWLISTNMELNSTVHLIKAGETEVLNLYYCLNSGSAFSMMEGKTFFLIAVTSVVIVALIVGLLIKKIRRAPYIVAVSLIIGGGVGNLIDRIFNDGKVVDFIDVRIINFAIFNFADICAVVGGLLLCLFVIIDEVKESREKKLRKQADGAAAEQTESTDSEQAVSGETQESNGND